MIDWPQSTTHMHFTPSGSSLAFALRALAILKRWNRLKTLGAAYCRRALFFRLHCNYPWPETWSCVCLTPSLHSIAGNLICEGRRCLTLSCDNNAAVLGHLGSSLLQHPSRIVFLNLCHVLRLVLKISFYYVLRLHSVPQSNMLEMSKSHAGLAVI